MATPAPPPACCVWRHAPVTTDSRADPDRTHSGERSRRRRLAGSCALAVAAIAAVALYAVTVTTVADHRSVAPSPPCRPEQLSATVGGPGVAAGNAVYRITISNRGTRCRLAGRPTLLRGMESSGHVSTLHPEQLPREWITAATTGRPAELTATRRGEVVLLTTTGCPAAQRHRHQQYADLMIGVRSGQLAAPFTRPAETGIHGVWLPCGVAMSDFYRATAAGSLAQASSATASAGRRRASTRASPR